MNQQIKLTLLFTLFLGFNSLFANSIDSLEIARDIPFKKSTIDKSVSFDDFSFELENEENFIDPEIQELIGKVKGAFDFIDKHNKYVEKINSQQLNELPIGTKKELNSVSYSMIVTKAKFTPEYASLEVFAKIETPQKDKNGKQKVLFFGADNVKLSYTGKIIGNVKLGLLGDSYIPFNGKKWMLTIEGGRMDQSELEQHSHVKIDCDGIQELFLDANLQISRNIVVPLDEEGEPKPEFDVIDNKTVRNRVRADFSVSLTDWNDLLLEVDLPPFAISKQVCNKERGHFSFMVNKAILDLSDTRNGQEMIFPKQYTQNNGFLVAGQESWRGLYIKNIKVGLPEEFRIRSGKRVKLTAHNFLIDNYGVSGTFGAENAILMNEGITNEQNAMAISLDTISVNLVASKLVGAGIAGKIQLPIAKNKKQLNFAYKGKITDDEYLLNVKYQNKINLDLWKAKAVLDPTSYFELKVANKEFLPKAVLNGTLSIADKNTKLKGINFEELTIKTKGKLISAKAFGLEGEHQIANFPISLSDINVDFTNNHANLGFGIRVGLQDDSFSASGKIKILGSIKSEEQKQLWKFKGIDIGDIKLEKVDIGIAVVSGGLDIMRNDPIYGEGFKANLNAKIKGISNIEVGVSAVFGKKSYRYWGFQGYVDGLPISTGMVNITGFTGSGYYHMIPTGFNNELLELKPDKNIKLGLRAGVYGNIATKETASFMAAFNIDTNSNGGLSKIGFEGEALIMKSLGDALNSPMESVQDNFEQYMSDDNVIANINGKSNQRDSYAIGDTQTDVQSSYPSDISKFNSVPIYAKLGMSYNFNNDAFHASLDVKVNVANGIIKGTGSNNTGWAVMHIDPKDWYLYIGTPQNMIGLSVGIGQIRVESQSYFMVGTKVLKSPLPPIEVRNILGLDANEVDYMSDLNSLNAGKGFAFGSHFKFNTGDMTMLFLYARFAAGFGSDIMLKNYGASAKCVNRGGKQIGINGWYANGQAYAYLQGELGIKIKLFFVRKKIPIIKAGAATLLQMRAPNPFWMKGYLAGQYNLLGGMVSGSFRFKLEFGEKCVLEKESVLGGMKIITDITPTNNSTKIDVFTSPRATFAMKTNTPVVISEDDGDHTYKILIDKFVIQDFNGNIIDGELKVVDGSSDVMEFVPKDILPPNKKLKAIVQVSFQEKTRGVYRTVKQNGKKAIETEQRIFTTSGAPDHIPFKNVLYTYPVVDQTNYYQGESNVGYIALKQGQDYLFEGSKWKTTIFFKDNSNQRIKTQLSYNRASNIIKFRMPNIKQKEKYTLQIVGASITSATTNNSVNKKTKTNKIKSTGEISQKNTLTGDNLEEASAVINKKSSSSGIKKGEIERLSYKFSTSKYRTLSDKINAFNTQHLWYKGPDGNSAVVTLQNNMNSDEYFDKTELVGTKYTNNKPLIEIEALLDDPIANYFKNLFYDDYNILGVKLDNHNERIKSVGIPPVKGIHLSTNYTNIYLKDKTFNPRVLTLFPYKYHVFKYYFKDWYDIQTKFLNNFVNGTYNKEKIQNIIESNFPVIEENVDYNARVKYILPGNIKGKTSKKINYRF